VADLIPPTHSRATITKIKNAEGVTGEYGSKMSRCAAGAD
jgi:hypothetical protein